MSNRLTGQSSPYLLQHAQNPVNWFPWSQEAFETAQREDKPIFLSIGYSTCHWCHVMAHESFENPKIAQILNQFFISIKVDREERPDIDSVYMAVCQAFTGSGGWPMSIFMTPQQKPFFAGTYFPPETQNGSIGFPDLLLAVASQWKRAREKLYESADQILAAFRPSGEHKKDKSGREDLLLAAVRLPEQAVELFTQSFDPVNGGFGGAPKFPLPHNLLFLLLYAAQQNSRSQPDSACRPNALTQATVTLEQMRRGGLFDHIGFGFSRYSTDERYLVPHFEKMLYDNALLITAYCAAYKACGRKDFLLTAQQTASYVLREMTAKDGAFYSAQDADSEGGEGRFYVWSQEEIHQVLGPERAGAFCRYYGVTGKGNFEGKTILNLLNKNPISDAFAKERELLYNYRKSRTSLHVDDKILTAWNGLMILALAVLYRVTGIRRYLLAAQEAQAFIDRNLTDTNSLYAGCRGGVHSSAGFLDDYAYEIAALLTLYEVCGKPGYLKRAELYCQEAIRQFGDKNGGFFLYGTQNDTLIMQPKESYDGALPSGNSVMAYCLVRLSQLTAAESYYRKAAEKQIAFLTAEAARYPSGYGMFLTALLFYRDPPQKITVVLSKQDTADKILPRLPLYADVRILAEPSAEYKRLDERTTYYICKNHTCLPPTNICPNEDCVNL